MTDKLHLSVPDFEPAKAKNFELCIEIGNNYFQYGIISLVDHAVKVVSAKASIIFNEIENSLLQTHFKKTKLSLFTQKFTFIPSEIFKAEDLAVYSKYIQPDDSMDVHYSTIDSIGITVVYAVPKITLDKVSQYFPDAQIYPHLLPFLKGVDNGFSQIDSSLLFVNFKPGFVEIAVYHHQKFQFYNTFEYQNDDELIYFILLAIQQNRLKLGSTTIKISGNVSAKSSSFERISAQFPRTEITDQDSLPLTYSNLGQPVMPRFFSLFSLHLCE